MSRPRKVERMIPTKLHLPADVVGRVHLLLFSEVHGCCPRGSISEFYARAATAELARIQQEMENGPKES
jgi:hypothetical protein